MSWELCEALVELHRWAEIFCFEFKLQLPQFVLCVDRVRSSCYGHYRYGHNGLGLRGEITISRSHLETDDFWDVLATLLHELLHAWQEVHGRPGRGNYHNKEFQEKARSCGLIVNQRGHTAYDPEGPFVMLLERHGVRVPQLPSPLPADEVQEKSKLKKWSCGCTNVRVAIGDFQALCLKCGYRFARERRSAPSSES